MEFEKCKTPKNPDEQSTTTHPLHVETATSNSVITGGDTSGIVNTDNMSGKSDGHIYIQKSDETSNVTLKEAQDVQEPSKQIGMEDKNPKKEEEEAKGEQTSVNYVHTSVHYVQTSVQPSGDYVGKDQEKTNEQDIEEDEDNSFDELMSDIFSEYKQISTQQKSDSKIETSEVTDNIQSPPIDNTRDVQNPFDPKDKSSLDEIWQEMIKLLEINPPDSGIDESADFSFESLIPKNFVESMFDSIAQEVYKDPNIQKIPDIEEIPDMEEISDMQKDPGFQEIMGLLEKIHNMKNTDQS